MWKGLLPIGSVVSLYGSNSRFMILSTAAVKEDDVKKVFDYCACLFPMGFSDPDSMFMFNNEDIDNVYCVGYLSPEGEEYRKNAERNIKGLRDGSITIVE
ncbi:DUF4176 domain-containing protein [Butyrivibrio sp. JL13D10]|uniref:DUF4176 domain-containing protein n=1 Tax=Butyrivibrio sp. JL13D10 TaxID=3236815 RepID=UPI0038B6040E